MLIRYWNDHSWNSISNKKLKTKRMDEKMRDNYVENKWWIEYNLGKMKWTLNHLYTFGSLKNNKLWCDKGFKNSWQILCQRGWEGGIIRSKRQCINGIIAFSAENYLLLLQNPTVYIIEGDEYGFQERQDALLNSMLKIINRNIYRISLPKNLTIRRD